MSQFTSFTPTFAVALHGEAGLSAVAEVLLRKNDGRICINDGMCGIFWELRF